MDILNQLPLPDNGKIYFPWTEKDKNTPPQYPVNNLPKITIVTPSYNQGQFIEQTIRSVLLQNYPNLEYIIIDGGSTDETVHIIKKYENWLTFWVSEPDNGQSHAINKGLLLATGDIFNWLNSDDLLAPNALWVLANAYNSNLQAEAFIGSLFYFGDKLNNSVGKMKFYNTLERTMLFSGMTQQSLFYRTEIFKILRGVDEQLYFCMDFDLWLRFLISFNSTNICLIDTPLAYLRIHQGAKSQLEYQGYIERRKVFLLILSELNVSKKWLNLINNPLSDLNTKKTWDLDKVFLNNSRLKAYIVEHILTISHFNYPLGGSFSLYFFSFCLMPFNRTAYFYSLPLRLIYRKIKRVALK